MTALFIVIEGADGAGKSTLAKTLCENFFQPDHCRRFFEPTDKTDAGRKIRTILKSGAPVTPEISRELKELFYIDRLWDIEHQIKPALRQGRHVILDRYFYSTAAYQGSDPQDALAIALSYQKDCRILEPDILFFLDIPSDVALQRVGQRNNSRDIFETEQQLRKIIQNYQYLFRHAPSYCIRLDATLSAEKLYQAAMEAIKVKLHPRKI